MRRNKTRAQDAAWRRAMYKGGRRAIAFRIGVILLFVGVAVGAAVFLAPREKDGASTEDESGVTCIATVYVSDTQGFTQVLTERETLEAVRALLGLTEETAPDGLITEQLKIKTAANSGWVYLSVTTEDGQAAADLANALAQVGAERYKRGAVRPEPHSILRRVRTIGPDARI